MFKKIIINLLIMLFALYNCPFVLAENAQQSNIVQNDYSNLIDVKRERLKLRSKFKKEFIAYRITIKNISDLPLELTKGEVINGQSGQSAYIFTDESTGDQVSNLWATMFPAGFFTLGFMWGVGIIATPYILIASPLSNKVARSESKRFDNKIPLTSLGKGDNIFFNILVQIDQTPVLKLTFKNKKTGEIYEIVRNNCL